MSPKTLYPCTLCDSVFNSQKKLLHHKLSHQTKNRHQCTECHRYFKKAYGLLQHQKTHLKLHCVECNLTVTSKFLWDLHKANKHQKGGKGIKKQPKAKRDRSVKNEMPLIASSKAAQASANAKSAKRRLDDAVSLEGQHKEAKLNDTRPAETSQTVLILSHLAVAIVRASDIALNKEQAAAVKKFLEKMLLEDVKNPSVDFCPRFKFAPILADGALKLWCVDEPSRNWLVAALDSFPSSRGPKLILKSQYELARTVHAALFLPNCTNNLLDIGYVLDRQNPWANFLSWSPLSYSMESDGTAFLTVSIPEHIVPAILERKRTLYYILGSGHIRFLTADGKLEDALPVTHGHFPVMLPREEEPTPERAHIAMDPMAVDSITTAQDARQHCPPVPATSAETGELLPHFPTCGVE